MQSRSNVTQNPPSIFVLSSIRIAYFRSPRRLLYFVIIRLTSVKKLMSIDLTKCQIVSVP